MNAMESIGDWEPVGDSPGLVSLRTGRPIRRTHLECDSNAVSLVLGVVMLVSYLASWPLLSPSSLGSLVLFSTTTIVIFARQAFPFQIAKFGSANQATETCHDVATAQLARRPADLSGLRCRQGLSLQCPQQPDGEHRRPLRQSSHSSAYLRWDRSNPTCETPARVGAPC